MRRTLDVALVLIALAVLMACAIVLVLHGATHRGGRGDAAMAA